MKSDLPKLHSLKEIIGLTICAVLSGCNEWTEIELYGQHKQSCFMDWVHIIAGISKGKIISIDGKRLYNAGVDGKKALIHMVSAWSNEITSIPTLLNLLVL